MRAVNVDALSPCSAVQIQYVSIARTCFGIGLAAPLEQEPRRRGRPGGDELGVDRRRVAVGEARRLGDDRDHRRREPCEVVARLRRRRCRSAARAPTRRRAARSTACRSAGALPVRSRAAYGAAGWRPGSGSSSTSRPQTFSNGTMPDEILDVDPAVAERAAVAVGLGDLRLEGDDALEARLELAHRSPRSARMGRSGRYLSRPRRPSHYAHHGEMAAPSALSHRTDRRSARQRDRAGRGGARARGEP